MLLSMLNLIIQGRVGW